MSSEQEEAKAYITSLIRQGLPYKAIGQMVELSADRIYRIARSVKHRRRRRGKPDGKQCRAAWP